MAYSASAKVNYVIDNTGWSGPRNCRKIGELFRASLTASEAVWRGWPGPRDVAGLKALAQAFVPERLDDGLTVSRRASRKKVAQRGGSRETRQQLAAVVPGRKGRVFFLYVATLSSSTLTGKRTILVSAPVIFVAVAAEKWLLEHRDGRVP